MTNAPSGAGDRFYVYRPFLGLLGISEGTAKGRGYNETLGYGIMLDGKVTKGKGPTIDLVSMTLDQVDKLQTRMLKDPDNGRLNSSAIGYYQIIRTTMRSIRKQLGLTGAELYNADMQDRMACYLLGQRGIDKWLSGRLSLDTLIHNLAMEWASIPKPDGKGHYVGQNAGVSVFQVKAALAEVRRRHTEGQPKIEVPVLIDRPVIPVAIDKEVKQKTNWLTSIFGGGGIGAAAIAFLSDADWQTIAIVGGGGILAGALVLGSGTWIVRRVKAIRKEWQAA